MVPRSLLSAAVSDSARRVQPAGDHEREDEDEDNKGSRRARRRGHQPRIRAPGTVQPYRVGCRASAANVERRTSNHHLRIPSCALARGSGDRCTTHAAVVCGAGALFGQCCCYRAAGLPAVIAASHQSPVTTRALTCVNEGSVRRPKADVLARFPRAGAHVT